MSYVATSRAVISRGMPLRPLVGQNLQGQCSFDALLRVQVFYLFTGSKCESRPLPPHPPQRLINLTQVESFGIELAADPFDH